MRQISQALQDHDLIVLRVIAEWWDLDLFGEDKKTTIRLLCEAVEHINLPQEIQYLPAEESEAMNDLVENNGRMPIAQFSRKFGEIREMGPAALEREEPWFSPQSPAEDLWYRGLIYRGFDDTADGMTEFIYLPDEFLAKFDREPQKSAESPPPKAVSANDPVPEPTTPAPPKEEGPLELSNSPETFDAALTTVVDDATTILTLAQSGHVQSGNIELMLPYLNQKNLTAVKFLVQLLEEMNILRFVKGSGHRPTKLAIEWLNASVTTAHQQLFKAWLQSDWNALRHVPTLSCEGSGWHNDPISPRKALIDALPKEPIWIDVSQLVQKIKGTTPDFQRPNGNYDTWYIRDNQTGQFLSGFEHWEAVEGQLIHFMIHAPMSWLGMVDRTPTAARLIPAAAAWLQNPNQPLSEAEAHDSKVELDAKGVIYIPKGHDRFQRFQVGRFAQLLPATDSERYAYRITPTSLANAKEQGITPDRVYQFLTKNGQETIPAGVKRAIDRWSENGIEARLEKLVVLRVADPAILKILREHPKTRPFLGESLGELAVVVQKSDWEPLFAAAVQLGLLLNPVID